MALHLWLAGFFLYAYARHSLQLKPFPAFGGALVYVGSGFLGSQAEQINQLNVTTWMPLTLLLLDEGGYCAGRRWIRASALLSITVALQFLAGHTQSFYINLVALGLYAAWPTLVWGVARVRYRKSWCNLSVRPSLHRLLTYGLTVLLGLGLSGAQLLPTLELSRLSVRAGGLSYRGAVSFSMKPSRLLLTLLPTFGDESVFGEHIAYLGVLPLGLACVGLLTILTARHEGTPHPHPTSNQVERQMGDVKGPHWGYAICLVVVGLGLALGGYNPLYPILYRVMPGIALFRVPGRWLVLYTFGGALLAGMGLQQIAQHTVHSNKRLQRMLPRVGLGCLLTVALMVTMSIIESTIMSTRPVPFLIPPSRSTLFVWGGLIVTTGLLLWWGMHQQPWLATSVSQVWTAGIGRRPLYQLLLVIVIATELLFAGQKLPYNHPTAPQAYSFLQPTVAFLRSDQSLHRFIGVFHPQFDPGNLADIRSIFSSQLSTGALYDYTVAAKIKALLERNLPLRYNVGSIDGYDGGVLPLRSFLDLQRIFLPEVPQDKVGSLWDGRLREKLERIPEGQILSLLNVKYVIKDKVGDLWIDNVYYDLAHKVLLKGGESVEALTLPRFPATGLGLISFLEEAEGVARGTPVAEIIVVGSGLGGEGNRTESLVLLAGVHTAQGPYVEGSTAHLEPEMILSLPDEDGVAYVARLAWDSPLLPRHLTVRSLLPEGRLHIRGLTLVDHRVGAFEPVVISTEGHYKLVHSGALKVYENLDVLPRAFYVPSSAPTPPSLLEIEVEEVQGRQEKARIVSYAPEQVAIHGEVDRPGYLVLTDTYYPGWQATVNGIKVPILRSDPYFRSVRLNPGKYRVEFVYRPLSFYLGVVLSGFSLSIILLGLVWSGHWSRSGLRHPGPNCLFICKPRAGV